MQIILIPGQENDPLRFRPRPENLVSKVLECHVLIDLFEIIIQSLWCIMLNLLLICNYLECIFVRNAFSFKLEETEDGVEEKKSGVYVPPKVAAMPYGQFCLFWRLFFVFM